MKIRTFFLGLRNERQGPETNRMKNYILVFGPQVGLQLTPKTLSISLAMIIWPGIQLNTL
jgi:hypothetical protein